MINECKEPPNFSNDAHGGQAELDFQPSPAKATRPYAGADDSMSETIGTTNMIQIQSPSKTPKPELLVGDLVWSKIPGHAWWPSMVSYEPNKAVYFQSSGRGKTCFKYHVQFFGDEPQRGWVSDKNMIKFTGRDPFTDLPNSIVSKRDKIPHSKQLRAWERALEQAQKALPLNRQQRKLCYVFKYNDDPQKAPKQNRSPEPTNKKKEKASKKPGKVRSRLTRRTCLLDKPKDVMNEGDYFEDMTNTESLIPNMPVMPKDGKNQFASQSPSLQGNFKREDTPEKATLRRRGRSAGNLSIDGSIVFDSVHLHENLKGDRKHSSIVSFNKADITGDEFVSVDEVKDLKLADEKVEMTKISTKFRGKGRKRPREDVKGPIMKAAKKIKVEIVTRKHNVFEIIPKKMKNKQTQTPERKTKRGVMAKKKIKRKLELTRNSIKTKETSASKKFSRKCKGEDVSAQKRMTKKGLLGSKKKQERATRQASSIATPKQTVKEKKAPAKKSCISLEAKCNDGLEFSNVNDCDDGVKQISEAKCQSTSNEKEPSQKRKRGRPRKLHKTDESTHEMGMNGAAQSDDPSVDSAVQDGQMERNPFHPIEEAQLSESTSLKAAKKPSRVIKTSESDAVERRELRRSKISLSADLISPVEVKTTDSKKAKLPSRRSARHHIATHGSEADCVVICKVSQLPEIDDIVEGNSEENSRVNGLSGYLNKGLLLEVLSDIDAEIPIELEDAKNQVDSIRDSNDNPEKSKSTLVVEAPLTHLESRLCSTHDSPSETTDSLDKNTVCSTANAENVNDTELNSSRKQLIEDHLQAKSVEHLSACSITESISKCDIIENSNPGIGCNSKLSIELSHQDANNKSYLPDSDKGVFDHGGIADGRQEDQHSCIGDIETNDVHPVASNIGMETSGEIDSCSVDIGAPRTFDVRHHLEGFINGGQRHEYFDSSDRGDANVVFPADSLSHVEAADVYLNDDDVGLPVSKDSRSCVLTSCTNDSFVAPYCKDEGHSGMLNKVSNTDIQFGKTGIDGLEEFQPGFSIPNLSLPDLVQSASYCQQRLDNPCSVISTIPNTNTNLHHIHSKYLPIDEAFTESLTSQANTQIVSTAPHSDSYSDPLNVINSTVAPSRNCNYSLDREGDCKAGEDITGRGPLISSSAEHHVGNDTLFENISQDIGAHSIDTMQDHNRGHCVECSHDLHDDKSDMLPAKGMVHDLVACHDDNADIDNNHGGQVRKQQLQNSDGNEFTMNQSAPFNGRRSSLSSQPVQVLGDKIKKSPTINEPEITKTHDYNDLETSEMPELESNTFSTDCSISDKHCLSERDNGMDSTKAIEDSLQTGNSLKRQRKRKAMSDFHVGLAFDEILSNRGRVSDGDKGASKLSLVKKKRDGIKKVDYEERTRLNKDADTTEQIPVVEDASPIETGHNRGKSDEGKRSGSKKRMASISEENTAVDGSDLGKISHDGKPLDTENEVSRIEETVNYTQGISSDKTTSAAGIIPEKKKRGRKPKVKDGKEKRLPANKPFQLSARVSADIIEGTTKSLPDPVVVERLEEKAAVSKPHKKATRGRPPLKLKMNNGETKPKRKYVRRKGIQIDNVLGKDGFIGNEKEKNEEAPHTDFTAKLKEGTSPNLVATEQETKPKRRYKKKAKITKNAAGKLEKSPSKKISRKHETKSVKKRKQEGTESFGNLELTNPLKEKLKGRKKLSKAKGKSALYEQSVANLLTRPKKYKMSTSLQNKKDQNATSVTEKKKGRKSKKLTAQVEDIVDESFPSAVISVANLEPESIIESNADEDNLQPPALPFLDSKKNKRNEKLETRSNMSDETASISGKESEEYGKNKKENICTICEQSDGLLTCNGVCYSSFHPDCLGLSTVPEKFFCDECLTGNHSCFLCKETGNLRKCSFPTCGKYYHEVCTQKMRGCKLENNRLICPLHNCGTCTNDKESSSTTKKRLLRCVRCPTAYHASRCLVAGCVQLTSTLMVCNRHFVPQKSKPHHSHYNVSWCFVCSSGGMLVCCDTCPAAFHPGCVEDLNGVPDETWQCDSCREGKKPLYGDLVWVKYGFWRWWPARICFPDEIPTRIQKLAHDVGEFPVMFFGSRDYCWLHAGRVFPYQEGDKGCRGNNKSGTNKIFEKAIREVEEAHKERKEMRDKQLEQRLAKQSKKPPPYKQIKVNKYISALRNVIDASEYTLCECSLTSENPCGPGSECINRMLQIECDKTCKAQDKCQNQRFQKCQQVDCVPLKTAHCGWGLKTRQAIKKGDFVIEYVGELIDEITCRKRINDYHDQGISDYYFLVIDKDNIIDAYPKGNASRFMNHCCDPNCDTQKWTVNGEIRVGLFANKDIEAGSELTFNYNLDTLGNEKKLCHCGSKNCSGFLGVRPKTQTAIALKERKKKEKQKKKKKKDKTKMIRHEDECFACGDGGELIMCDRLSCSKCYHLKCLTLPGMPKGKWDCPWHFCDVCGKRATYYCSICPNSFCGPHHEGEVLEISEGVYICDEHTQDEIREEEHRLKNKLTERTPTCVQIQSPSDSSEGKT